MLQSNLYPNRFVTPIDSERERFRAESVILESTTRMIFDKSKIIQYYGLIEGLFPASLTNPQFPLLIARDQSIGIVLKYEPLGSFKELLFLHKDRFQHPCLFQNAFDCFH